MADRLFVYGTLLPGHAPTAMADVVARMPAVGGATVRGRLYSLGSYPGLVLDPEAGPVHGVLLETPDDPAHWLRLDAYEGFDPNAPGRSLFCRVRGKAQLESGEVVDCWVYAYNGQPPDSRRVASGDWRNRHLDRKPHASTSGSNRGGDARRPIIGITLDYSEDRPERYAGSADYGLSVERAGGLPVYLPFRGDLALIPQYLDLVAGVVFAGGDDLDPSVYGETFHPRTSPIDPDRQRFEMALIAEVERRRLPVLGICLGSQLMNVHRGGSLFQYLPEHQRDDALDHRKDPYNLNRRHPVRLAPDTAIAAAVGTTDISVNTRHKQAVNRLGKGLRVIATAPDGVVEAIEDPTMPMFLGVQWHPENLTAEAEHLALFKLLVEKARNGSVVSSQ